MVSETRVFQAADGEDLVHRMIHPLADRRTDGRTDRQTEL